MADAVQEVLIVELAGQRFGLAGAMVCELLRAVLITPLPRSARFVEGVISIRGQIVPVLDLRQWLGLPAKAVEPADHLVIVRTGQQTAALRVDRALELARLEATGSGNRESGVPWPAAAARPSGARVVRYAGGLVVLPDLSLFLAQGKSYLEDASSAAPEEAS